MAADRAVPEGVAIVTVTYNSSGSLAAFLRSTSEAAPGTPVTVVDNASDDIEQTRALARTWGARLIELPENVGYGAAVNAGARAIEDAWSYLLISNPDVELHPGSVDRMRAVAAGDPRIGAVGPRILDSEGRWYPSARKIPSLRVGVGHALFGSIWPRNPWTRSYREEDAGTESRDAGWLSGACLLVRREAFEGVRGFDERYFMYFEDVDLGERLGRAGWRNRYLPDAVVTHVGAHSTTRHRSAMEREHHRSAYRFIAMRYSRWYYAPVRWAVRAGIAVRLRAARGTAGD